MKLDYYIDNSNGKLECDARMEKHLAVKAMTMIESNLSCKAKVVLTKFLAERGASSITFNFVSNKGGQVKFSSVHTIHGEEVDNILTPYDLLRLMVSGRKVAHKDLFDELNKLGVH